LAFQPSQGARIIHPSRILPQATAQNKPNDQLSEQNHEAEHVHPKRQGQRKW
jgi:hypothetical protein